ncbi:DUF2829 domain-containing protein [Aureispira anguillae]|nr:DUF2829 domain-containing protein [Aureispira anguillae]
MDFGDALKAVKNGKKIQRQGWNGKGMHVALFEILMSADDPDSEFPPVLSLYNAQGKQQLGWAPSQADLMAEDWSIID